MRNNLQQRLEQEQQQGIDLSPLIDVVFILLIFFVVTTVFVRETGVEIDKPQAVASERLTSELIIIAITGDDEVIYDRSHIGVNGVRATVAMLLRTQQRPVVIQADKRVSTDLLVQVIDQVKLAGATSVNLATVSLAP
ncbi:MAG: biopolymer transporter ExbD [Pseudomonadales bacterium]|nr:biopolymer transporter ExbD [Pseudomonadales bacterium]